MKKPSSHIRPSRAAPEDTVLVVGANDLIVDLDGKGHSPIALGAGELFTSDVLTDVKLSIENGKFVVKPADWEKAKKFASTVVKRQQIENVFDFAQFAHKDTKQTTYHFNSVLTLKMYTIAQEELLSNTPVEAIKKRMGDVFDAKINSLNPKTIVDNYIIRSDQQHGQNLQQFVGLSHINPDDPNSLSDLFDTKHGQEIAYGLRVEKLSADKKTHIAIKRAFRALPEWARLIAEENGTIITTLAPNKKYIEAGGLSYRVREPRQPLHIFISAEIALNSSEVELNHAVREEVIHSLHSRSDQLLNETKRPDCFIKSITLYEAFTSLHEEILSDPKRKIQVETLIKMTEPNGGSLLKHGWESKVAVSELLVDVLDAQKHLREKMGKTPEETAAELEAVFGKAVVDAVRNYLNEWMEEAAGIAEKRYDPEKAVESLAKWKKDPMTHELELEAHSVRVQTRAPIKRSRE